LKILQGKARYDGDSKLQTWLFAVIRNTAVSERRKTIVRSIAAPPLETSIDAGSHVELERSELQQQFQQALQQLPARQRETLHLVFYQELTLSEAAQVMNISIGSARQHYERGKKRLRELLDRGEENYGVGWRRKENPGAVL
jgi:RNA polymerase sigma-70 factor, ECF subfamily